MARVVLVHGIANTFGGQEQMSADWVPALLDGVALAGGADVLNRTDIAAVAFGHVFRRAGRFLGPDDEMLDADDIEDELEAGLLMAWWRSAAAQDPAVMPPDARVLSFRDSVRAALAALVGSRFVAHMSESLLVHWLRQVTTYFTDESVRRRIQAEFASGIKDDTRVVVAHSLGSVVAYEGHCAGLAPAVTDLVTLGSPLAVPNIVFDRLRPTPGGWPGDVKRWVNISSELDLVALEPVLRKRFGPRVVDVAIHNGAAAHDVRRYLSAAETGAAILAGLKIDAHD